MAKVAWVVAPEISLDVESSGAKEVSRRPSGVPLNGGSSLVVRSRTCLLHAP